MIMPKKAASRVSQRLIGLNFVNDPYVIVKKLIESNLFFFQCLSPCENSFTNETICINECVSKNPDTNLSF